MVQFECPRHWNPSFSLRLGEFHFFIFLGWYGNGLGSWELGAPLLNLQFAICMALDSRNLSNELRVFRNFPFYELSRPMQCKINQFHLTTIFFVCRFHTIRQILANLNIRLPDLLWVRASEEMGNHSPRIRSHRATRPKSPGLFGSSLD